MAVLVKVSTSTELGKMPPPLYAALIAALLGSMKDTRNG